MTYYTQRLIGALLGFFVVGPLVTMLSGAAAGPLELLLGGVVGAIVGALVAGAIARSKDKSRQV